MPFAWTEIGGIRIRHTGTVRSIADEPARTFGVVNTAGRELFGELVLAWYADKEHFSIEVRSFGYFDVHNVGNPSPGARASFTADDIKRLGEGIAAFFADPARFPMRSLAEHHDGRVSFATGWVLITPG